jgi:hypothetical protein
MEYNNIVEEIEEFSNHKLKRKNDLKTLFEISSVHNKTRLLEDLCFTAKYILGLQRILKKGSMNPEIGNLEKLKEDYSDNFNKAVGQIKEILIPAPEQIKTHFNKNYLELSGESFSNLNNLLEDLEWAKMYLNKKKRQ